MERKTSLVAGGAGFLGSHLCDKLLSEGHNVICLDNFITSAYDNVRHLESNPNFEFIRQDVSESFYILQDIDYIFHFASPASPLDYLKFPIETLEVGSYGTHNLLEFAKKKEARILLSSTSEVYGDPEVHPQVEEYWGNVNPVGPRGVYDEAKRFSEALFMAYHNVHGLETRIARIFNTFGERMRLKDGRAIPAFISQALRGENITIFGTGTQTRSVMYVSDLVEGIYELMMSNYHLPVNIGNPQEISMIDLASEILKLVGSSSNIVFEKLPVDDPKVRCPDITKAKTLLGWQPMVSRKVGLIKTIKYFKEKLDKPAEEADYVRQN